MAALANDMTALLNKIEWRLGLLPLTPHLPKEFGKEAWADVIMNDTLAEFSRFYGFKVPYTITKETPKDKDGYYILDGDQLGGAEILGIMDIDWTDFGSDNLSLSQTLGYGLPDMGMMNYGYEDIFDFQMRADQASLFNNGIYPDIKEPNKFKLVGAGNFDLKLIDHFKINVLIKHPGLYTISPTKMTTFEALAQADVANFLYNNLKYYEGIETVYASIDMKLSDLQNEGSKREQIMADLEQNYVNAGNTAVPIMFTI